MANTNVSFEMNSKTMDEMDRLCQEMGMTPDEAFQIFAKRMVNEQQMPFEVTAADVPESRSEEILHLVMKIAALAAMVAAAIGLIHALVRLIRRH